MRKIEKTMVAALRDVLATPDFTGRYWRERNTCIWQQHRGVCYTSGYERWAEVILYDTVIALVEPALNRISFYSGGFHTVTTRSRINALLSSFGPGWSVFLSSGRLMLRDPYGNESPFKEGFTINY